MRYGPEENITVKMPRSSRSRVVAVTGIAILAVMIFSTGTGPAGSAPAVTDPPTSGAVRFSDVTEEAGIRFQHVNGAFGKKYLPETMGSGGAFLDIDGDGWLDILLVNSSVWKEKPGPRGYPAVYLNQRDGTFRDITRQCGLEMEMYGMGVTAADYDNDGDVDVYITGLGPDRLFRNERGTFRDVTTEVDLGNPDFSTSATFFDYDNDGWLDLFVANYVQWTPETDIFCSLDGRTKSYCTPEPYKGTTSRLYRNLGGRRFQDVTREAGLYDTTNKGLGVAILDFNEDGLLDIALANDTQPNRLWRNEGDGTFHEVGVSAGIAFSEDGTARGAMGIDAGDYDHSGRFSLLIGNFSNEMMSLYHNEGLEFFIDDAPTTGVGEASLLTLTFGCFFFDFDLDGWLDIFAANGHVENEIEKVQRRVTYAQPVHLFHNREGKHFVDVAPSAGEPFRRPYVGRGAAYGDYDNDGRPGRPLTQSGGPARLFRNDRTNRNHWIAFQLVGEQSNHDAIGAVVKVTTNLGTQQAVVHTGGSYCSQSQLPLIFGLGPVGQVDRVEVIWPLGRRQIFQNLRANRYHRIHETSGLQSWLAKSDATPVRTHVGGAGAK